MIQKLLRFIYLKFENEQYDGQYEVCGIDIDIKGELFNGLLYYPPTSFKKPYPLIIYFHSFPFTQPLQEIVRNYKYLLDMGYALIVFNFRGYGFSQGSISIESQVIDAKMVMDFVKQMFKHGIFDVDNINILAHDFGAYVALLLCSKEKTIKSLLLLTPILDVGRHVCDEEFLKVLFYINRFYPGYMRGIEDVDNFVKTAKKELSKKAFQIENAIQKLKIKRFRIILGEVDKITPVSEVNEIIQYSNVEPEISFIEGMDHEIMNDEDLEKITDQIKEFFKN